MERSLRRLMRMSSMTRNWTILSNYAATLQNMPHSSASYSQDSLASKESKNVETLLNSSDDPKTILQVVKENYAIMNGKCAAEVMTSLFKALKGQPNCEHVKDSKEFLHLCKAINKDIRLLNFNEIIGVFKVMTYLKVPTGTVIIQTILQILRISVNEIPVEQIPFVHFLLGKHEKVPLVEGLLTALPLVFQNQLRTKLDRDNVNNLAQTLLFACDMNNEIAANLITNALVAHQVNIDIKFAKIIHRSLAMLERLSKSSIKVLFNMQEILLQKSNELSSKDINGLINDITRRTRSQQMEFYDEYLIDALINAAVVLNPSFSEGINILQKLNKINYSSITLLDYLAAKCFEDPLILTTCTRLQVQGLMEGVIVADYKPVFWDTVRETILSNNIGRDYSDVSAIQFGLYTTALDCYHPEILKKAFSTNFAEVNIDIRETEIYRLLLLYQSVKTLYPQYTGPWPSETVLEKAQSPQMNNQKYCLKAALERTMGGSQYVKSQLRTKLGHFVDHFIVVRPDGLPMPFDDVNNSSENDTPVEDIQSPPKCRRILIFNFPEHAYSINCQRLKSTWSLMLRSTEALAGFYTIAINSCLWQQLPEHERIPYLKQAIRLKCDDILIDENQ